jgi:hypothetical protein
MSSVIPGDRATTNILLQCYLGIAEDAIVVRGDNAFTNQLLQQLIDNGASGNAPSYREPDGTATAGDADGDRWVKDQVEYFWDSSLGSGGAWVEVQSCTLAPQTNFAGVANATNLWITSPPSGLSNGFVLSGLRLAGQPTSTSFDASNYWEIFIRYTLSGTAANVDLTSYTANSIDWTTGSQWSGANNNRFLVQPGGELATFTARVQIGAGTPGSMNAMASVRVHRAIVPA